jgi:hypothetical protein
LHKLFKKKGFALLFFKKVFMIIPFVKNIILYLSIKFKNNLNPIMEITSLNPQLVKTSAAPLEVIKHVPNSRGLIVYETTNYDMFRSLSGNRVVNPFNVRLIVDSIKSHGYLSSVVIVNENMEVIDGQHRINAAKEAGMPVLYAISQGYGVHEVQVLNSNAKNWTRKDYLSSYCELGLEPYIKLKAFWEMYPMLNLTSVLNILALTDISNVSTTKMIKISGAESKSSRMVTSKFKSGGFEIPNLELSVEIADHICQFADIYPGYNRTSFVAAIVFFMKNEHYKPSEMISKLLLQPTSLVDCPSEAQYKELLEKIYNFKRKASNRVSLAKVYGK